jgi:hypothetical protein
MVPGSTLALVVFGVDNLTKTATLLDELAAFSNLEMSLKDKGNRRD